MNQIRDRVLERAIKIQQIPSPSFHEGELAEFIAAQFQIEGLENVEIDSLKNVYACWKGREEVPPLIVSAHTDTVFPLGTDLTIRREPDAIYGPGIGDNSLGVAGLFGLLWLLKEQAYTPPGDLWLVANVCEEGLGDLKGMRAVVERFGSQPKAYLVVEGMALGQVYHRGLGVQRYRITAQTEGGHSWVNFGRASAIHQLADLVTQITAMPIPTAARSSFNVGIIQGGTSVNTIAAEASLELDLRSEERESLQKMIAMIENLVTQANTEEVKFSAEIIGQRPAGEINSSTPLVQLGIAVLQNLGFNPQINIGSTDANIPLSLGYPSICVGLTHGKGAHTVNEVIYTSQLAKGLQQLTELVQGEFLL